MRLTPKYYAQAWFSALNETDSKQWSEVSQRMLEHVYKHGNVKWLPEIVRLVTNLQHEHAGTTAVTVKTAHELDGQLITRLVQAVLPNVKAVIEQTIDTRVIGGIQIETTNQRWDLSVKGQLTQLAHSLN
jgi:F0F1-type ATP synthase delta subunit